MKKLRRILEGKAIYRYIGDFIVDLKSTTLKDAQKEGDDLCLENNFIYGAPTHTTRWIIWRLKGLTEDLIEYRAVKANPSVPICKLGSGRAHNWIINKAMNGGVEYTCTKCRWKRFIDNSGVNPIDKTSGHKMFKYYWKED